MSMFRRFYPVLYACFTLVFVGDIVPCFSQITPPEEYLGFKPGADFELATYEQWVGYFDLIAGQTDRLQLIDMGLTSAGRQMKYAVISSEENMADIEKYKEITRTLSLAQDISEQEAVQLAEEGKAVVWIEGGIHSTESSPPMHQFQLAYDLVTGIDKTTESIRENVILVLMIANPDGMTIVADWYMENVGSEYETSRPPVLYHIYAGHDNNRDTFLANLVETQNINRLMGTVWYPELMYSQHERAPFPARIWVPPSPEPVNPNMHPLIYRWKNLVGSAMGHRFGFADMPGVISRTSFDLWYPGYTDGASVEGHNIPSVLTETANYGYATPNHYTLNDFPEAFRDLTMGTFYPQPWQGGWWRFRDAVQYNLTASMAVLEVAAKYRYDLMYSKYKMAKDVVERFNNTPPFGWILSVDQPDPNTTVLLLNRLIEYGIDLYTADEAFSHNGITYPGGSYILPTNQPFGYYIKNIFGIQDYPDLRKYSHLWQGISRTMEWNGGPLAPYDGVAWTVPLQMGVLSAEITSPLQAPLTKIAQAVPPAGSVKGSGSQYVFSTTDNNSYRAVNRILKAGGAVSRALNTFTLNGIDFPNGSFIVGSSSLRKGVLQNIASETHIPMNGGQTSVSTSPVSEPRIGIYTSWVPSMDSGWITYIFDTYEFPYQKITDAEMKAGKLHDRFDIIILPDQAAASIINGHKKGTMPPEYTGGISQTGVENLKTFVKTGGTLLCNNSSSDLPISEFNLPIQNVLSQVPADSFNCPGSLLKMNYNSDSPVTFGMPEKGIAHFLRGHAFEIWDDTLETDTIRIDRSASIVARYPDERLLVSGWIVGEEKIRNRAAIVDVSFGAGNIVLFGFNVLNRAQTYSTFKLLFNALYM
jgi:hypothetical protein